MMVWIRRAAAVALVTVFAAAPALALAAAGGSDLSPAPAKAAPPSIHALDYELEKELVVRDWVLCVSRPVAEIIVHARALGVEQALAAYAEQKAKKSCGQFPELRVILHEPVYQSAPGVGHDARVFSAAVNLGGGWANVFLVYGGLPVGQ